MKNLLLKYTMKNKKEDVFHSSAYGKAQNGGSIGVASTESFAERMKMEKNRKIVHEYNESRVMSRAYSEAPKAKKYVPPEKREKIRRKFRSGNMRGSGGVQRANIEKSFAPQIKPDFGNKK